MLPAHNIAKTTQWQFFYVVTMTSIAKLDHDTDKKQTKTLTTPMINPWWVPAMDFSHQQDTTK